VNRNAPLLALLLALGACASPETPPPDSGPAPVPLSSVGSFVILLQEVESQGAVNRLARSEADLVIVDRADTQKGNERFPMRAVAAQMRARTGPSGARKLCIAYVNAGQAEDYRTYWDETWRAPIGNLPGEPGFLIAEDPAGWPGNYPVAYWTDAWRAILLELVDEAALQGLDGVLLDWVEGFADERVAAAARAEGLDPAAEMVALLRSVARRARESRPGFLVILIGGAELVELRPGLAEVVDGVLQESVSFTGGTSKTWSDPSNADTPVPATGPGSTAEHVARLTAMRGLGLTVLTLDYATTPENVAAAKERARSHGFVPCVSRTPLSKVPRHALPPR